MRAMLARYLDAFLRHPSHPALAFSALFAELRMSCLRPGASLGGAMVAL